MSAQSTFITSGWAYWPSSDRYQLTPKWEEFHADTDRTANPNDEPNRMDWVGQWGVEHVYFVLQLRDTSDPDNPAVPESQPVVTSRLFVNEGWIKERTIPVEFVLDDLDAWTGDLKFDFGGEVAEWVGPGTIANFTIDALFPEDESPIRIGYGTILLRR